ncbi:MAG: AraC family transcriptional regulator [Bacteroidota bacterium]
MRSLSQTSYQDRNFTLLNLIISLFGLGVITWFMLQAMRNPALFHGIDQEIQPLKRTKVEDKNKYKEEIAFLSNYMTQHQPYLDEGLSLQSLARTTEIPEKHLSFLINRVLGQHFFDFINSYRIQEAQELLKDKDLNIQQVMYQVGFNSKSSFNTAFKKYTSHTPTTYRKSIV